MSARRKIIAWCPHDENSFVVGSSDLRLYRIAHGDEETSGSTVYTGAVDALQHPDDRLHVELLNVNSEVQHPRCLEWQEGAGADALLAAGLNNGRVQLTSFPDAGVPKIHKEFVPHHARTCNVVSWNPSYRNQLAAGLDKVRSSFSLLVWDVEYSAAASAASIAAAPVPRAARPARGPAVPAVAATKDMFPDAFDVSPRATETVRTPQKQLANSESTVALSWLPSSPMCLVAGTGVKWLRVYDLRIRDSTAPRSVVAHTKSVLGVRFDPFHDDRLLTFSEDGVFKLWDMRKMGDAIFQMATESRGLVDMSWCPSRPGVLASISKDESVVKVWDIKDNVLQSAVGSDGGMRGGIGGGEKKVGGGGAMDEAEKVEKGTARGSAGGDITLNKPYKAYRTKEAIVSMSWHAEREHQLLTCTNSGVVQLLRLQESAPIAFSANNALACGFGAQVCESYPRTALRAGQAAAHERVPAVVDNDISVAMQRRAVAGYSVDIDVNVALLADLGPESDEVMRLWKWMRAISSQKITSASRFQGLCSLITDAMQNEKRSDVVVSDSDFPPIFSSVHRDLATQICGWPLTKDDLSAYLLSLVKRDLYERAVAVAVFNLELERAVTILASAASSPSRSSNSVNLKLLSMALAGFSCSSESLWQKSCGALGKDLKHPYLRSCFAFLMACARSHEEQQAPPSPDALQRRKTMIFQYRKKGGAVDDDAMLAHDLSKYSGHSSVPMDSALGKRQLLFTSILQNEDMDLTDRIGFACRFLPDDLLVEYLEGLKSKAMREGTLGGCMLTGLNKDGVQLFQAYVNKIGDIQTAALVLSHVVPARFRHPAAETWLQSYRDLLDRWGLWHTRAVLDIAHNAELGTNPPQVYARCSFCNQCLSMRTAGSNQFISQTRFASRTRMHAKEKINGCPQCNKPLPNCSVCHMSLSCSVQSMSQVQVSGQWKDGGNKFSEWFTWCNTCHHGGHSAHILAWFSRHRCCPVSDCQCACDEL